MELFLGGGKIERREGGKSEYESTGSDGRKSEGETNGRSNSRILQTRMKRSRMSSVSEKGVDRSHPGGEKMKKRKYTPVSFAESDKKKGEFFSRCRL